MNVDSVLNHDSDDFTRKYSTCAFRKYVKRIKIVARIATRKVRRPAIEAEIESGESVSAMLLCHRACLFRLRLDQTWSDTSTVKQVHDNHSISTFEADDV